MCMFLVNSVSRLVVLCLLSLLSFFQEEESRKDDFLSHVHVGVIMITYMINDVWKRVTIHFFYTGTLFVSLISSWVGERTQKPLEGHLHNNHTINACVCLLVILFLLKRRSPFLFIPQQKMNRIVKCDNFTIGEKQS